MSYLFVLFASFLLSVALCEEKLIFAYSYSMAGSGYPKQKVLPWTRATSLSITPAGVRQQYILGRELRNRLVLNHRLLDHHYNPQQVQIHPLMVDRGVESAYAQMAGLYHVGTGEVLPNDKARSGAMPPNDYDYKPWIESLGWPALNHSYQVMSLILSGEPTDSLIDPEGVCPSLKDFIVKRTREWRRLFEREFDELTRKLRVPKSSVKNIIHLSELRELVLAGIVEGRYIDNFESDLKLYTNTRRMDLHIDYDSFLDVGSVSRLVSTPVLADVKAKFVDVRNKAVNRKIKRDELKFVTLLGLNRRILLSLLKQLKIMPQEMPMPASIFLLELYEVRHEHSGRKFEVRYTYDKQKGQFDFDEFIRKIDGSILSLSLIHISEPTRPY
eukprot:TRINITY_DN1251_c0_g3_i1.p1 TRINITY_DN1251_c0_g3~~TRINITY_DN1251_c0_g3_i1.p1  ORF type:complete len:386 (+),score=56.04 TRINITY_DN1251_c0_g3_i1:99-1256(+)